MKELKRLPGRRFDRFFWLFGRIIGFKPDETGDGSGFKSEGFGERDFLCHRYSSKRKFIFEFLKGNSGIFSKGYYSSASFFIRKFLSIGKPCGKKPFNYPEIFRIFLKFSYLEKRIRFFPQKYLRFTGRDKGIFFRSGKGKRRKKKDTQNGYCNLFHSIFIIPQKVNFVKLGEVNG